MNHGSEPGNVGMQSYFSYRCQTERGQDQGRASNTRLKGVSVARRNRLNPPLETISGQKLAFISIGRLSFEKAASEQFQTAVFPFNTISAFESVIGDGACNTNRIRMIERINGLKASSISLDAFASSAFFWSALPVLISGFGFASMSRRNLWV